LRRHTHISYLVRRREEVATFSTVVELEQAISFPKPAATMISPDTIRTAIGVIGE